MARARSGAVTLSSLCDSTVHETLRESKRLPELRSMLSRSSPAARPALTTARRSASSPSRRQIDQLMYRASGWRPRPVPRSVTGITTKQARSAFSRPPRRSAATVASALNPGVGSNAARPALRQAPQRPLASRSRRSRRARRVRRGRWRASFPGRRRPRQTHQTRTTTTRLQVANGTQFIRKRARPTTAVPAHRSNIRTSDDLSATLGGLGLSPSGLRPQSWPWPVRRKTGSA